jgi:GWxTD domain-containing protein
MKIISFLLLIAICTLGYTQTEATIGLKKFDSPSSPFIETYISIFAGSVKYIPNDRGIDRCKIEVLQMLKKDGKIIDFQKIVLENKGATARELYNDPLHQHRFFVENGAYEYEVEIVDLFNDSAKKITYKKEFKLEFNNGIAISDIELLDSFWKSDETSETSKSGFEMVPLVSDYFSPDFDKIAYYFEIYNTDKEFGEDSKYVLQHFIESYERGVIAGSFNKLSKEKSKPVNATLNIFEIGTLPTGNYNLVVQVKNRENQVVTEKKLRFQRLNLLNDINPENLKDVNLAGQFTDRLSLDSLDEYIYCLRPISTMIEKKIADGQLDGMTDTLKLQYIYSFWYNRNTLTPEKDWNAYKFQVKQVQLKFGTRIKKGYETDRGRIFLKYGAPNTVHDQRSEANSYPYQIWHYYKIGKFNDKRFVFYDRDLVTNDYQLLHSDLIGEIKNFHWKIDLKRRSTRGGNVDDANPDSEFGDRTDDLFYKPR